MDEILETNEGISLKWYTADIENSIERKIYFDFFSGKSI